MRRILLAAAGAGAMLAAAAFTPAKALTIDPGAIRPAIDAVNPVEKAALCWRWGWRGWGYYPCWPGPYYAPYYYSPYPYYYRPYYRPFPFFGWGFGHGFHHRHW